MARDLPRCWQIAIYLRDIKCFISVSSLAEKFGVSVHALYGDIYHLKQQGVVIDERKYLSGKIWKKEIKITSELPKTLYQKQSPSHFGESVLWQELLRRKMPFIKE